MNKYENQFDEAIDNCPYSSDWGEQREYILRVIDSFYDQCVFFRSCTTLPNEDNVRIRFSTFELFGILYVWSEFIENGLSEAAQLEKVRDYDESISFVMYSSNANAQPLAPYLVKMVKERSQKIYNDPELSTLNK